MKSLFARSKILLIRCLVYFVLTLWKIYVVIATRFHREKKLDISKCKAIVFNRSDRIWDAVVSIPFFRAWIDFARNQLDFHWRIIIFASEWNEFVLRELIETHGVEIRVQKNPTDYVVSIVVLVGRSLKNFFQLLRSRVSLRGGKSEYVGFDMVGDTDFICDFRNEFRWNIFGGCIFPIVVGFDYPTVYPYVSQSDTTLLQTYAKICSDVLAWFQEFPRYLGNYIESALPERKQEKNNQILLFVGTKKHRNLLNSQWHTVVSVLSESFPDKHFTILDDPSELVFTSFLGKEIPGNVTLKKSTFLLGSQELKDFLSGFDAIIWIDGGGMNFMRHTVISATIYTTAQSETWRPFLWNESVESVQYGNWELTLIFPNDEKKQFSAFLRKKSIFVPTYEIPERKLFEDFPPELLVEFVKRVYEFDIQKPAVYSPR